MVTDFGFGPNDDHKANKTFHLYATTFFYCAKCFIINYLSSLMIILKRRIYYPHFQDEQNSIHYCKGVTAHHHSDSEGQKLAATRVSTSKAGQEISNQGSCCF